MDELKSSIIDIAKMAGLNEDLEFIIESAATKEELKSAIDLLISGISEQFEKQDSSLLESGSSEQETRKRGNVYNIKDEIISDNEETLDRDTLPIQIESFHDVVSEFDQYNVEDFIEGKGRALEPIYLDDWPEILIGDRKKILAVDIARYGDAKTVILVMHGGHVIDIQSSVKQDFDSTAGFVWNAIQEHSPDEVVIDGTGGWGPGVSDRLVAMGVEDICPITLVLFNQKPREELLRPLNARAEMYLIVRDKLKRGEITLPPHAELGEELAWTRYKFTSDDKIRIIAKEEIQKTRGRSPDFADALALACYGQASLEIYV